MLMPGAGGAPERLAQALARAKRRGGIGDPVDAWQNAFLADCRNARPPWCAVDYAVLPLRLDNDELIVGGEDGIDPVSAGGPERVKSDAKCVTSLFCEDKLSPVYATGMRAARRGHDPRAMLYTAVQHQWLTEQQAGEIWRQYVPHQFLFAEILTTLGHINRSAINVLLLRHERSSLPLGKFLVTEGVISQETLDRVLTIQRELQVSMQSLLLKAGLNTEQVAQLESENRRRITLIASSDGLVYC